MMSNTDTELHKGHRQRLINRFFNEGLEHFEDHNILELLLFFGVPYKDTNEIAHELINRFGSIAGVFDADAESLREVKNMTNNAVALLKLIPELSRKYAIDLSADSYEASHNRDEYVGKYLEGLFLGKEKEETAVLFLNKASKVTGHLIVSRGDRTSTVPEMKMIFDALRRNSAAGCIIAHNHPKGNLKPSIEDLYSAGRIHKALEAFGTPLVESYIVAGSKSVRFGGEEEKHPIDGGTDGKDREKKSK